MKIALIQMTSGADMAANSEALRGFVAAAARQGAGFVATPENTFLMESPGEKRQLYTEKEHPGVIAAAAMAKQYGVWLLVGSVAVQDSGLGIQDSGKSYNRSLLFSPDGHIAARYDKIHLFDVEIGDGQTYKESAKVVAGQKAVVVRVDDGWRMADDKNVSEKLPGKSSSSVIRHPSSAIGLTICYDLRFPHLYRTLAKAGAKILFVPAAFTQVTGEAHWHVLLRARAIENSCFVIAPAQCGTHPGNRKTYGHSLVVDPWGKILADGGSEPGIVMVDIDLSEVERVRRKLPSLEHDRSVILGET